MGKEKNGINILNIVQILIMAALLAFIVLMLLSGNSKNVDMAVIEQKMETDETVTSLTKKNMGDAAQNFSIDMDMIDEGIYYRVDDVMDVNELLIVKVADDNNRQAVIDAVTDYLTDKTNSFDGYGTNQFGLLSSAILDEKGEYIFFAVSDNATQWESEFQSCIS